MRLQVGDLVVYSSGKKRVEHKALVLDVIGDRFKIFWLEGGGVYGGDSTWMNAPARNSGCKLRVVSRVTQNSPSGG